MYNLPLISRADMPYVSDLLLNILLKNSRNLKKFISFYLIKVKK